MLAVSDPSVLKSDYVLPPDYEIMTETSEVFTKALLLGMEPEQNNFADDVDVLPFEEAVAYMRKRLPVDGKTYYALADKMRFRAFTVSRLADGDAVRHVQSMLVKAMDEGNGIQQFLQLTEGQLADAAGMGKGAGWYYETVYRTNTATAYNVGRAIGFEETPPVALELIGIDDARQTEICHSLTVPPFRKPYGDPVWEHMWPPFHFNCRTTIRAIYDESEIEDAGGPDKFYTQGAPDYMPDKGFGTYPLDRSDTWWDLTDAMEDRADEYGLAKEFEDAKEKLVEADERKELLARIDEMEKGESQSDNERKRFNETFEQFDAELKNRIGKHTWDDLDKETQTRIINVLKGTGSDIQNGQEFLDRLDSIIQEGKLVTHQDVETLVRNIESLEKDPRIKTLFETETSEGSNNKEMRNRWEQEIIRKRFSGTDEDGYMQEGENLQRWLGRFDEALGGTQYRPVYGEIVPEGANVWEHGATRYGDFHMILNNNVRERATYTFGNSSNLGGSFTDTAASAFAKAGKTDTQKITELTQAINLYDRANGRQVMKGYTEAHFWGGIDLSRGDVREVIVTKEANDQFLSSHGNGYQRLIDLFKSHNIPVRIVE